MLADERAGSCAPQRGHGKLAASPRDDLMTLAGDGHAHLAEHDRFVHLLEDSDE